MCVIKKRPRIIVRHALQSIYNMKKISILAPCYNEEVMVDEFFLALNSTLKKLPQYEFEIVIVNDGSSDETLLRLDSWLKKDSRIVVVDLTRNFGKEIAITAALDHAKGDAAIILDFDLQDPTELILDFVKKWEEGFEAVIAVRVDRKSDSFLKRKTAEIFYSIYNKFADVKIAKNAGDSRLLDRKIIDRIKQLPERQRFMKGLFFWVGARCTYVNYVRQKRKLGESKFSGWKLWNFALEGITSFSTLPLRIWTYIGFGVSFLAFIYGIIVITKTVILGIDLPGYSSLMVATLFLGGIQIMGIGIVGEYLGRVYMESKRRPIYLVREVICGDNSEKKR